jgi:hypothetical protein
MNLPVGANNPGSDAWPPACGPGSQTFDASHVEGFFVLLHNHLPCILMFDKQGILLYSGKTKWKQPF